MSVIEVQQHDLAAQSDEAVQVIDVREPHEFEAGHVPGAINIPLGELSARIGELDRSAPVFIICQSGGRSARGAELLMQAGFDAVSVAGGTGQWINEGRPVVVGG